MMADGSVLSVYGNLCALVAKLTQIGTPGIDIDRSLYNTVKIWPSVGPNLRRWSMEDVLIVEIRHRGVSTTEWIGSTVIRDTSLAMWSDVVNGVITPRTCGQWKSSKNGPCDWHCRSSGVDHEEAAANPRRDLHREGAVQERGGGAAAVGRPRP